MLYKGGAATPPTNLEAKPSGAIDIADIPEGPNGITFFVDGNADDWTANIDFYGGLKGSGKMVYIETVSVRKHGQVDNPATLWRSCLKLLDLINIAWVKPYPKDLVNATEVTIYGAPY